jgi:hypothetical protein
MKLLVLEPGDLFLGYCPNTGYRGAYWFRQGNSSGEEAYRNVKVRFRGPDQTYYMLDNGRIENNHDVIDEQSLFEYLLGFVDDERKRRYAFNYRKLLSLTQRVPIQDGGQNA